MSTSFKGFGDAAKLFAKYKAVVDEMQTACEADIDAFYIALDEQMRARVPEVRVDKPGAGKYWYWWLETPANVAEESVACVWVRTSDIRIIDPGILRAGLYEDGASAARKQELNSMAMRATFPSHCAPDKSVGWFAMTIKLGDDPIEAAAEPLILLMQAIREV